ncbi:glycosyltransferase family 9 protein [Candidatus Woesearchaeota archaeon]|nr:glycosyltransferase family 9 protein [Candidatus Woesearchaeota archaeon]
MKVDFMRSVDYFIGVPICFLLSLFVSLERLFGLRKPKKGFRPKKILFIELSEMGSAILAYSSMKKAKELFNAQLYFMIFKENEESVKLLNLIPEENIINIRSRSFFLFLIDTISAVLKMRSCKIDAVVDLELFSRFTSILCFFSRAKEVAGFYKYDMEGLYRGNFQTRRVHYNPYYHISQNFMSLVYSLDADIGEVPLLKREIKKSEILSAKVISTQKEKASILKKLQDINPNITSERRIILLNPNASQLLPIRKWPLQNFMELAEKILAFDKEAFIVMAGTKEEAPDAKAICDYVKDSRCIDFTGKTTLKELVGLYNMSKVLVTNDSGPAHFASLTPIKIIVLFGPETPLLYSPLGGNCTCIYSNYACSPCVSAFNHRKTPCTDSRCLKAIKVEEVFDIVKASLWASSIK